MRISARVHAVVRLVTSFIPSMGIGLLLFLGIATPAAAQSVVPSPAQQTAPVYTDYREPNFDGNVPRNNHTYTQSVVIDVLAALTCQLVGIDPVNPKQECLGINPITNKLGYTPEPAKLQFGQPEEERQIGGALGSMTGLVSGLYTPTISSMQYSQYLASNFGIVKSANAQAAPAPAGVDCSQSQFGYGFCGLQPIFSLWVVSRDFAYAILVIAFIFLGLGVMLRFKVDPRTVMTLQNQIPRVIIAILLITFSYAIAGIMIDLMWTVTYAGVNAIAGSSNSVVRAGCAQQPSDSPSGQPLAEAANNNLLDYPFSFANRIYLPDCNGNVASGVVNISAKVSDSFSTLVLSIIDELMGWDDGGTCSVWSADGLGECLQEFGLWITELIIGLIIFVALFVALFRLWFELVKAYITFFIFVILGPVWIVMGLIPGRPLGFEKWMRMLFANLAAFPLVAFILVFARLLVDAVPAIPDPRSVYVPPLVGNPNAAAFNVLMAFGAILIAPTIPAMIREKMKAGSGKLGATLAAGTAAAAGIASAPASKTWKNLNRRNSTTGAPEGALAVWRHRATQNLPGIRTLRARQAASRQAYHNQQSGSGPGFADIRRRQKYARATGANRQRLYDRSGAETQEAMVNSDQDEAIRENRRRGGP